MTGPRPRLHRAHLSYLPLTALAVLFGLPLVFMFMSSLKPDLQIFADLKSWRAFAPVGEVSMANYAAVFDRVPAMQFMLNSLIVALGIVVVGLVVNSMAGFTLSRLHWRGRGAVFAVIIATLIVPFEVIAVPMVFWVTQLPWIEFDGLIPVLEQGWMNSYRVQIVPFIANAFSIFLFAQYFSSIPRELDEAARIDGCSWFGVYRKVIVPLSGPAFATVAILTFLPSWNSYLWPLMVVQQEELRPVQVGVQYFFQLDPAWGEMMAYTSMITVPVLVFFVAFQRAFVKSIASTGLKG
jgi:multiple sugar transport system permease protein